MSKKLSFIIPLILVSILFVATPAAAWYGSAKYATIQDIHLTDTYWWAREMGFTEGEAKNIAKHDDSVDMGVRFFDKTWHLDRSHFTGDDLDTRLKHANEEMQKAQKYISQVPGSRYKNAKWLRGKAHEHLGHGLHAIQDIYAHMAAGAGQSIPWRKPSSHGMEGVMVEAKDIDGIVMNKEVELLYDDVLWDYTPEEGWHRHKTKDESSRWQKTKEATKQYLYEFLLYGYGPSN